MASGGVRRSLLTAAGVLTLIVAGTSVAGASTGTGAGAGWRITGTVGAKADFTETDGLVAVAANDAFADWSGCAPTCPKGNTFTVGHWNGSSWRDLPWPQSLHHYESAINIAGAMGASSASDLWLLEANDARTGVIRWNGKSWSVSALPPWAIRINGSGDYAVTPVVAGPSSGWLFSLGYLAGKTPTYAAREIHGKWFKANLGAVIVGGVVAYGANDIWLTVTKGDLQEAHPKYFFMHWNGKNWSTQAAPTVSVPHNGSAFADVVAATGTTDLWALISVVVGTNPATEHLMHWNGRSWARVGLPGETDFIGNFARDGHGGLWAAGQGKSLSSWYFFHYSGGHWSKVLAPVRAGTTTETISELVQVPGTAVMLAGGALTIPSKGSVGVSWQYGQ